MVAITTDAIHAWQCRLREETDNRNLTELHHRIATWLLGCLVVEGRDQLTHAEIATALKCSMRTVGDALRRLRGIGLLDWGHQFIRRHGRRWQLGNLYWLRHPSDAAAPRPDLRRQRRGSAPEPENLSGLCRPSSGSKNQGRIAHEGVSWQPGSLLIARQKAIERQLAEWKTPPTYYRRV
jgi:hypothetical protein